MEKSPLIFGKISAVMKDIGPIAKDRKNTQQGYAFRGIDELMNAISPILTKNGVFPATLNVEGVLYESVTSKSGGSGTHLIRRFTFRFYAEDGSYVDTMADGEAIDYGDKASNKAYSVAYREAIFKMFVIPFENDDIENADHELKAPVASRTAPGRTTAAPTKKEASIEQAASKDRLKSLLSLHGYKGALTLKQVKDAVLEITGKEYTGEKLDELNETLSAKLEAKEAQK